MKKRNFCCFSFPEAKQRTLLFFFFSFLSFLSFFLRECFRHTCFRDSQSLSPSPSLVRHMGDTPNPFWFVFYLISSESSTHNHFFLLRRQEDAKERRRQHRAPGASLGPCRGRRAAVPRACSTLCDAHGVPPVLCRHMHIRTTLISSLHVCCRSSHTSLFHVHLSLHHF